MDDRMQRFEAEIAGLKIKFLVTVIVLVAFIAVGAVLLAPEIFKVEYNGTTRMSIDQQGIMTVNADAASNDAALKFLSASTSRGDIKFIVRVSDPTTPSVGDFWYNSTEGKFKFYDGYKRTLYVVFSNEMTQTVDDATVNNYDGTRGASSSSGSDDPTWTQNAKLGGSALSFDGGDYVDASVLDNYPTGKGTISLSAWINFNSSNPNRSSIIGWWWSQENHLRGEPTTGKVGFYADNGPSSVGALSNNSLNDGLWHFVVGTYDKDGGAGNVKLYVDGVLQSAPATLTGNLSAGGDKFNIAGIGDGAATYFFTGFIDESAIWNKALSLSEVQSLYNSGAGAELVGNESGLVSVWHMNDPK